MPAMDLTTSFRVGSSFALPEVVRSLGHSPDAVFAAANVDPGLYRDPENRIAAGDLGRLFHTAADVTGRQDIGLLVTSGFQPPGLGLVGLLAAEGPDAEASVARRQGKLRVLGALRVLADPAPTVRVKSLGDSGVHLDIAAWLGELAGVEDEVRSSLYKSILRTLRAEGIQVAYRRREASSIPTAETGQVD